MSGKSPAFQFYVKDYLTDVVVREMSFEHRGVYVDILCHLWNAGGSLPSDLNRLATIIGMKPKRMQKVWPMLERCFEVDGELIRNPRINAEILKQEAFRLKQKLNGLKGGKPKRINKTGNPGLPSGEAQSDPNGKAKQSSATSVTYLPKGAEENHDDPDDITDRHAAAVERVNGTLAKASEVLNLAGADILALPSVRPPKNAPITNPAGVAVNEAGIRLLETTADRIEGLISAKRGDAIAAELKRAPQSIFDQQARVA